jgi:hypothetical protein
MEKNMNKSFKYFDKKLFLQYVLIVISSLCIGFLLPKFLNESFILSLYQKIALHFEVPVYGIKKISDWFEIMLKYALQDIVCLCIVFLFSFSKSNPIISGTVLVYLGIKNGCEASLVYFTYIAKLEYSPSFLEICVFFILKTLLVAFIIRYIIYASLFSEDLRCGIHSKNTIIWKTAKFIVSSLLYILVLLFLHGVYGFIIKNL